MIGKKPETRKKERGGLFDHPAPGASAERINEAVLHGLSAPMIEKGAVSSDDVFRAAARVRREMAARDETLGPGVALRVDGDGKEDDLVPVNCAGRIHIRNRPAGTGR